MIDSDKKYKIRKADIFFLLAIAATAFIVFIILRLYSRAGSYAVVSYDGSETLIEISLGQSEPRYFLISYHDKDIVDTDIVDTDIINRDIVDTDIINRDIADTDIINTDIIDTDSVNEDNVNIKEFTVAEWAEFEEDVQIEDVDYNVFVYQNHEITMLQSSCPDKICVHHKAISMTGENIICLPHKLVIKITGDKNGGLDGVVY